MCLLKEGGGVGVLPRRGSKKGLLAVGGGKEEILQEGCGVGVLASRRIENAY